MVSSPTSTVSPTSESSHSAHREVFTTLLIDSPCTSASAQPVTVGIPFPKGVLTDQSLALLDAMGREQLVQTMPLARWSDGSVKWLLLDFVLDSVAKGCTRCNLTATDKNPSPDRTRHLAVGVKARFFSVDTGVARFRWHGEKLELMRADPQSSKTKAYLQIRFDPMKPKAGWTTTKRVVAEAEGPVRTTIKVEGIFSGRTPCSWVARFCFFTGTSIVRIRFTLHNPQRAKHPGGLWNLGDPGSALFRSLGIQLVVNEPEVKSIGWITERGESVRWLEHGRLGIYQDSSGGDNWQSRNHVNRNGEVPCTFRGYHLHQWNQEESGSRANPFVYLQCPTGTIAAAIPEFWQQFPKAIRADCHGLEAYLFLKKDDDLVELQGGEQKTHTVWFDFNANTQPENLSLDWVHQPVCVRAEPEWYANSGAIPHLAPAHNASDDRLETLLSGVISGNNSVFARREIIDEYGWRNYGEVYADHEAAYYKGPQPVVSHYNNQYDFLYGALRQYFRTGDRRWFDLADPLARHVIDIDIYHTDQDKAAYNGGLFWFTDHYKDAATSTHRTYSKANCKPGDRSYGGGPGAEHNFTTGLFHYYYLTGDANARDAVISLADWVINMDDGRQTILGIFDDGPTGLASQSGEPNYHGPGRGCGNSVNALLDGWLISGQRDYLQKAEELIRRSIHPADDVAARDLLNAERRWSYTVFLSVVARYLDLKVEAGERNFMYAYARASLLTYARWMVEHEAPYYDHPEKLQYPTETWAAQDFRKANVLRLAAAHAEEPLRDRCLKRASELAERAWTDLLRFESRTTVRSVAIMMVEGSVDSYFRNHPVQAAAGPDAEHDFGKPAPFVPQKVRVLSQIKTAKGIARYLARLANPLNWSRIKRSLFAMRG